MKCHRLLYSIYLFFFNRKEYQRELRKRIGGHWERWYLSAFDRPIWFQVEECSKIHGNRPTSFCHGTPTCEDYTK